jgi:hypothetical protein
VASRDTLFLERLSLKLACLGGKLTRSRVKNWRTPVLALPQVYNDEEGRRSLDLTETTSFGYGGFVEVPPGEFQINLGGTAQQCDLGSQWPGDVENSVAFPVRENYITGLTANCLPP